MVCDLCDLACIEVDGQIAADGAVLSTHRIDGVDLATVDGEVYIAGGLFVGGGDVAGDFRTAADGDVHSTLDGVILGAAHDGADLTGADLDSNIAFIVAFPAAAVNAEGLVALDFAFHTLANGHTACGIESDTAIVQLHFQIGEVGLAAHVDVGSGGVGELDEGGVGIIRAVITGDVVHTVPCHLAVSDGQIVVALRNLNSAADYDDCVAGTGAQSSKSCLQRRKGVFGAATVAVAGGIALDINNATGVDIRGDLGILRSCGAK